MAATGRKGTLTPSMTMVEPIRASVAKSVAILVTVAAGTVEISSAFSAV